MEWTPGICPYCKAALPELNGDRVLCPECMRWIVPQQLSQIEPQYVRWLDSEQEERCLDLLRSLRLTRNDFTSERSGLWYQLRRAPTTLEIAESLLRGIDKKMPPQGVRTILYQTWAQIRCGCGAPGAEIQQALFLEQLREFAVVRGYNAVKITCKNAPADKECQRRCMETTIPDAIRARPLPCGKPWCDAEQKARSAKFDEPEEPVTPWWRHW